MITDNRFPGKKLIPILFSTSMVRAILTERKTATRRIVKPQPIDNTEVDGNLFEGNHKGYVKVDGHPDYLKQFTHEFCQYSVGDILWVRESFFDATKYRNAPIFSKLTSPFVYRESGFISCHKWKPSIHMPYNACRIWLEIVSVSMERLHDISEFDAKQEGSEAYTNAHSAVEQFKTREPNYRTGFAKIWMEINGEHSWVMNPWVWVIKFKNVTPNQNIK